MNCGSENVRPRPQAISSFYLTTRRVVGSGTLRCGLLDFRCSLDTVRVSTHQLNLERSHAGLSDSNRAIGASACPQSNQDDRCTTQMDVGRALDMAGWSAKQVEAIEQGSGAANVWLREVRSPPAVHTAWPLG